MLKFDLLNNAFVGDHGTLKVLKDDPISLKLAMLIEGECSDIGPTKAANRFGFTKQRYFQLRKAFIENGAIALMDQKRGPKSNYRRTSEVICQVIRHRLLDPDASSEVIAQKMRQCNFKISIRTIERIFEQYGLQKKTLQIQSKPTADTD